MKYIVSIIIIYIIVKIVKRNKKNRATTVQPKEIRSEIFPSNINSASGLYIVTLTNTHSISVNAADKRIAHKAIKVTKDNCKIGKAKKFSTRKSNYKSHFKEHMRFTPLALLDPNDLDNVEKAVLKEFDNFRMRGNSGKKNEWLQNITPDEAILKMKNSLEKLTIDYKWVYAE